MFQRNALINPYLGLLLQKLNFIRFLIIANLGLQYATQIDGFIFAIILLSLYLKALDILIKDISIYNYLIHNLKMW